jgi:hypothetical protein
MLFLYFLRVATRFGVSTPYLISEYMREGDFGHIGSMPRTTTSALPRQLLHRATKKIETEFDPEIRLKALAEDSGYSRAHYLRTFRARPPGARPVSTSSTSASATRASGYEAGRQPDGHRLGMWILQPGAHDDFVSQAAGDHPGAGSAQRFCYDLNNAAVPARLCAQGPTDLRVEYNSEAAISAVQQGNMLMRRA